MVSGCTESSLLMFMDGVEEFYKCFMDKINQVLVTTGKDVNVRIKFHLYLFHIETNKIITNFLDSFFLQKSIDITILENAYYALTNKSLLQLHNYYKNEVINRNRAEIIRFKNTQLEYEKLVEESEQIQKMYDKIFFSLFKYIF